jgi:pullulanase
MRRIMRTGIKAFLQIVRMVFLGGITAFAAGNVMAGEPILSPTLRAVPGEPPTAFLRYSNPTARTVVVAGSWDAWSNRWPTVLTNGVWTLDVRSLSAAFGQHEFKFIVNGDWESGDNRVLYLNENGLLEKPSDAILEAQISDTNEVRLLLRHPLSQQQLQGVRLIPPQAIRDVKLDVSPYSASLQGYLLSDLFVVFIMDEAVYGARLGAGDRVAVAGNFNGWDSSGGNGRWLLKRSADTARWELSVPRSALRTPPGEPDILFKFVVNGNRWLPPPASAPNATPDGRGNSNLRLAPTMRGSHELRIYTEEPINLAETHGVVIEGWEPRPVWTLLTPGPVLDRMYSDKPLGVILDREQNATTYRIFAPRARAVYLCIYDRPEYETHTPSYRKLEPVERYRLWKDAADGVWEISLLGLDIGKYYSFNVEGPTGNGEGFNPMAQVGDPYARAAAHGRNNCIVIAPEATNRWFGGWTDGDHVRPPKQDALIYEMHVRGMTIHPSSDVPPKYRGKFEGLLASLGTGTGLDHLKELGVTHIELLPPVEFNGNENEYSWGYGPVLYFAPEASYGQDPKRGSQYYEFKRLVDGLHRAGFGVIIDVVFNHVGSPNFFHLIDKKYYFRLNPDFSYMNYSGCGNDFRTEAPMARRLIVDNILFWIREFHVDGFRFDLAELIDMDTMLAIRDAVHSVDTNILLISEPWSLRGDQKPLLKGTGWSAWNNDFRYAAKDFATGRHNRDWLKKNILGSVETWAADPLQPVNYLESHDDMALADELCTRPDRDGRKLQPNDVAVNRLAATILFTSLGIPMIHEGQEFLRSKWGLHNTYNRGDAVNAVNWNDRSRPYAAEALAYYKGLMQLRRSSAGAAFRVAAKPPPGYFRWIEPRHPQALGYIVNTPRIHEGAGFIVLLNAAGDEVAFTFELPAGRWKQIGDGERLVPSGLPDAQVLQGPAPATIRVPPIRAFLFQDGF